MRNSLFRFVPALYLLFAACSAETSENTMAVNSASPQVENEIKSYKPQTGQKADAVFLCDFTSSLDTAGWSQIIANQISTAEMLNDSSRIRIYGIDETSYNKPVFEGIMPGAKSSLNAYVAKYKKDKSSFLSAMKSALEKSRNQALKADKKSQSISCITVSMRKAYDLLHSTNKSKYTPCLFVFSDMIEQCSETAGKVDFCKAGYNVCNKQIQQNYHPDYQLKPLLGSHIFFVITPTVLNCTLKDSELRLLWQSILVKYGYTQAEAKQMHFDSSIPSMTK